MKDNDITPLNIQKDIEKIEELLNSSSNERPDAEKFIPKWVNSVPDFQRHILAAMLLIRARILKDDLDKALEQAKECAGDNSEKKAYVEQIRRTLLSLTRDLSDPEFKSENLKNIRDDIEIFTTKGDITSAIETYLTLINRCRIDRDFGVAKEELKRAHKLLNMNKSYFESEGRGFDWSRLMAELYFLHALVYGLGLQGNIYDKLEAIRYCAEAEKLATLTGDVSRKAAILNVRGLLLYQLAERSSEYLNEAEKSFDKSFELHLRIGDPRLTFQPLRNRILAQRLRALHSKHLARKYWLDKAGKSCYYARQQLNQMELKKEVISADMKEIIYQEFKIKGLQGNKKDACTSLEKEVLKYWEERKDLHQQARIWQDLMKLAHDNDSEKNYFASLLSIISAIFEDIENGSDRYRNDILRFENIRDMLIDAYMIAHKNEDHTGRQSVVRLMKKGEDFAKKYRFEALTQDFKIWSSAN